MIDSAEDEVRAVGHQRLHGEHHAVGWCAVHLESSFTALDGPHGMVQRERMASRALLPVGSHDRYLSERLRSLDQTLKTVGEYPIVIGAQQSQRWNIPARWRHKTLITSHASLNSRK